jgi:hypothetical protein
MLHSQLIGAFVDKLKGYWISERIPNRQRTYRKGFLPVSVERSGMSPELEMDSHSLTSPLEPTIKVRQRTEVGCLYLWQGSALNGDRCDNTK